MWEWLISSSPYVRSARRRNPARTGRRWAQTISHLLSGCINQWEQISWSISDLIDMITWLRMSRANVPMRRECNMLIRKLSPRMGRVELLMNERNAFPPHSDSWTASRWWQDGGRQRQPKHQRGENHLVRGWLWVNTVCNSYATQTNRVQEPAWKAFESGWRWVDKKLSGLRGYVPNSRLFTSLHLKAVCWWHV